MPGSITPLPVMLEEQEREELEKIKPPKSVVVRYGRTKLIAELPYDGKEIIGCGTKLVIRTDRGIELSEMLTTACPNAGCSVSITRKQMLQYIEKSGGKKFPFYTKGKVLRLASVDDTMEMQRQERQRPEIAKFAKQIIGEMDLPMKLVDVEMILGGERILFHYTAEQWVDFRDLVKRLASEYQTRIEMHQVNARDEARLVADYERCGQHCCCKQFLKVLKPVSMRSAKIQKATLDPAKISGRCGRLMCCLRYEDETYDSLRKRLPHKQTAVKTEDGIGTVIGSQILTQLVQVRLDDTGGIGAYPLEEITTLSKDEADQIRAERQEQRAKPQRNFEARQARRSKEQSSGTSGKQQRGKRKPDRRPDRENQKDERSEQGQSVDATHEGQAAGDSPQRTRERPAREGQDKDRSDQGQSQGQQDGQSSKKKRKRGRRRRRRGGKGRRKDGDGNRGGENRGDNQGGENRGGGGPPEDGGSGE